MLLAGQARDAARVVVEAAGGAAEVGEALLDGGVLELRGVGGEVVADGGRRGEERRHGEVVRDGIAGAHGGGAGGGGGGWRRLVAGRLGEVPLEVDPRLRSERLDAWSHVLADGRVVGAGGSWL